MSSYMTTIQIENNERRKNEKFHSSILMILVLFDLLEDTSKKANSNNTIVKMKFLTTNFLKCSVKSCDISNDNFPLKYDQSKCKLAQDESIDFNPDFLLNILDRVEWDAIVSVAADLGNTTLPAQKPTLPGANDVTDEDMIILRDLHTLLMQTSIIEGEMKCRNCGHIYYIKNSIPNLLLPPHLA